TICDAENLKAVSLISQNTKIYCIDYKKIYDFINNKTFVYFDPPYRPINEISSFMAYVGEFNDNHQIELAQFFIKLHQEKKPLLMLSNSDPKNHDENYNFFENLYSEFNIHRVLAKRNINSKENLRGLLQKLLLLIMIKEGILWGF
ncbi:MAG: DNA adenine methylase, partial [Candidatus Methanomethyliaceae archaeon]